MKMKKRIVISVLIILFLLGPYQIVSHAVGNSAEDQYVTGMEYFDRQDYDHAFSYFQISGEIRGYAPAQNMLGVCYRDGLGTQQDSAESERYFRLAAEQGNSEAAENLSKLDEGKEEAYQSAVDLYFAGKYEEAGEIFKSLGEYEHSESFLANCDKAMEQEKERQKESIPVITSITLDANNYPTIKWNAVQNAEKYKVISSEDNKTFSNPVYSNFPQLTRFIKFEEGNTYYFKVCSVFSDGKESEYSEPKSITVPKALDKPKIISITLDDNNHPIIEWTDVKGAEWYELYYSKNGSSYSKLTYDTKDTSYAVKFVEKGKTYYYKVQAKAADGSISDFSTARRIAIPSDPMPTPAAVNSYYIIGNSENTFGGLNSGLYKKMCINLDLDNHPIPTPDEAGRTYGGGDYERIKTLKNDRETIEQIGYVYSSTGSEKYIIRTWIGKHETGAEIRMDVYYTTDGKYVGNIQYDLTTGRSTSSSRINYSISGQKPHNLS